ncbi:MAG: hypothetical protein FWG63_00610 [Defluviitaleaceae bacterium]|nr:hypothetical protein [Defluviitaleaceae bacterium]
MNNQDNFFEFLENEISEKEPSYLIDILPKRSLYSGYFKVEDYFLTHSTLESIRIKHIEIFLKLMCYYECKIYLCKSTHFSSDDSLDNLESSFMKDINCLPVEEVVKLCSYALSNSKVILYLYFPSIHSLIVKNEDDYLILSIFGFQEKVDFDLLEQLSSSEGLFLRKMV